ncbi:hypothetical protein EYZ11_002906 [Aspergillus tanneri]|uniref:STB6-like N-terminal domain-containing protein n=1 Tax=Aspergillus tanneri TaxID=1220188 RepID=A0A4S3JPN9_9EURO|nr:uncharacterized protein ATNIH1004_011265 [Aspergillus tanneri]KAA8642321.1 hypothetical protein ATNIH1004_011265 [Aspergillus tanneri]THC97616.1 hypothetical protein EYZ11_002906 [Aspergillus tanneri]
MPPTTQNSAQAARPAIIHHDSRKTSGGAKESPSNNSDGHTGQSPRHGHQKFVFTDPVALRYLEEDPSTIVLHRRLVLQGYEIYVVEQWACSRIHPTFIITTYTGDTSHKVTVGVLGVPTDESTWSPRLQLYVNAVTQCQARRKETTLGTLMVTDLSSFPSALTVIPVPDGDVIKHKDDFLVNENLKRLNCSGRAGLKLQPPASATEAKFHQLYRTSERVPLYNAVLELVKQCQIALMMFGNLAPEYVDGLLCDVTEAAISDWWTDMGMDLYNIEPSDGGLGPTTVAALLGTLMGARNRLHAFGAPVGKDAFDIHNLKRGISSFQKSQKLKRTRRLDRQTLDRLHRVTAKAANSEGWTDAVKSTMAELSGHGGEMVMGMVRGREKGGIADIETLDIDNFAQLVNGERAKWLWRGKPRKSGDGHIGGPPAADMMFTTDDQGGYVWTSRKSRSNEHLATDNSLQGHDRSLKVPAPAVDEKDQNIGRMVRRGVSERVSDARIGFGKFKDAVGLRSHVPKQTKEGVDLIGDAAYIPQLESDTEISHSKPTVDGSYQVELESAQDHEVRTYNDESPAEPPLDALSPKALDARPPAIRIESVISNESSDSSHKILMNRPDEECQDLERWRTRSTDMSGDQEQASELVCMSLRRPQSCPELNFHHDALQRGGNWPRHLSFSTVEDVMLGWEELVGRGSAFENSDLTLEEAIVQEDLLATDAQNFALRIQELREHTVPWVEKQVDSVDFLNTVLYQCHEKVNAEYMEQLNKYQAIRDRSSDLLTEEHSSLTDHMRRIEMLGAKLDYELNVLSSKIEDVETGLGEFERQVNEMELRVKTLIRGDEEKQSSSWLAWLRGLMG